MALGPEAEDEELTEVGITGATDVAAGKSVTGDAVTGEAGPGDVAASEAAPADIAGLSLSVTMSGDVSDEATLDLS